MKSFVVAFLAVFGTVSLAQEEEEESWQKEIDLIDFGKMAMRQNFQNWKMHFDKSYESVTEELDHFSTWIHNLQRIAQWNSDSSHNAALRANQFADLNEEQFRAYVHGSRGQCFSGAEGEPTFKIGKPGVPYLDPMELHVPDSVDWEAAGKVTPVKDQGQCGSCWAFSTTGAIECQSAIKNGGSPISLSEQQLVDCSHGYGNLGCSGGEMDAAFKYVIDTGGLCLESAYKYTATNQRCQSADCDSTNDPISSYTDVKPRSESDLLTAAANGCVSVAIEADQFAFQFYSSGVLDGECGTNLDHGVLVVGYGTSGGQEYWKVKNSWGTSWGEEGYVLICRDCGKNGQQGECGINDDPSYPNP